MSTVVSSPRVDQLTREIISNGAVVLPFDLVPDLDSAVLWDAVDELRPASGEGRQHVRIKPMFDGLSPSADAELGPEAAAVARRVAQSLASVLGQITERLSQAGLVPADMVPDAAWSSILTRWDASEARRLPMHADWELLTFVVSPDGGLEFEDGLGPSGPAAVLVAGELLSRLTGSAIPAGAHAIGPGGFRRSLMTFFLGNPSACWEHGRTACACSPTLRETLEQQYLDEEDPA